MSDRVKQIIDRVIVGIVMALLARIAEWLREKRNPRKDQ